MGSSIILIDHAMMHIACDEKHFALKEAREHPTYDRWLHIQKLDREIDQYAREARAKIQLVIDNGEELK